VLTGSCHCGATRFEVTRPPAEVAECNCSICTKRGALWAYYQPEEFRLVSNPADVATYRWGDRMMDLNFCPTCGCATFNEGPSWAADGVTIDFERRKYGVNARLFDAFDLAAVPVRQINGRDM
jgi:hypothetical protein